MDGMLGIKVGMTRVYNAAGHQVPVTVVSAGPCVVVQRKTAGKDGYESVQIGLGERKAKRAGKAQQGHSKKAGAAIPRYLREFKLAAGEEPKPGDPVTVAMFEGVGFVDVTAISKGRGFQGVVRRYRMQGGRATHGSGFHRQPGSVGMRELPGRVLRGKRLPGHMGNKQATIQNLALVQVRPADHVLLIQGTVPGPAGGLIVIRKALKKAAGKKT